MSSGRKMRPAIAGLLLLCLLSWPGAVPAQDAATADICRITGANAAARAGLPEAVMQAITLTETGRKLEGRFQPWPWTVNMEGVGRWFATRAEAEAYARAHYQRGARSFDVGCFQINYRWHGQHFPTLESMFDPDRNAAYAAAYLRELYAEKGAWPEAAGAYHSRTPKFANRYKARFQRILAQLNGAPLPPPTAHAALEDTTPVPELPALPWVPPPPSQYGSIAAIDALPARLPLLIQPTRRLY